MSSEFSLCRRRHNSNFKSILKMNTVFLKQIAQSIWNNMKAKPKISIGVAVVIIILIWI